jgi:hypothetical protein
MIKSPDRTSFLVTAVQALADNGYQGPKTNRQLKVFTPQEEVDALYALSLTTSAKGKQRERLSDYELMIKFAHATYLKSRKPGSERLAGLQGALMTTMIERQSGTPDPDTGLKPLQAAMCQFLLSDAVQQYKQ